jgi:hypothetical protein
VNELSNRVARLEATVNDLASQIEEIKLNEGEDE